MKGFDSNSKTTIYSSAKTNLVQLTYKLTTSFKNFKISKLAYFVATLKETRLYSTVHLALTIS